MGGRHAPARAHGVPGSLGGAFWPAVLLFIIGATFAYGDVSAESWGCYDARIGIARVGPARTTVTVTVVTVQLAIIHPRFHHMPPPIYRAIASRHSTAFLVPDTRRACGRHDERCRLLMHAVLSTARHAHHQATPFSLPAQWKQHLGHPRGISTDFLPVRGRCRPSRCASMLPVRLSLDQGLK